MGEIRTRRPESAETKTQNKLPGPIVLAVTGIAVAVLVCIHYDWWPSRFGGWRWADPLLFAGGAVLVLAVTGLVWAIRTLYVIGQDRRWSWWIAAAPAVVGVAALVAVLFPPTGFDDLRPEFERIALDVRASPEQSRTNVEIGRFDFLYVRKDTRGAVYFVEAGGLGLTVSSGWAYSPDGPPAGFDDFSATHIGGAWYKFTAVWRD